MSRHPIATPEALELEIERAWVALCDCGRAQGWTIYLSPTGRLFRGSRSNYTLTAVEVGTYNKAVHLEDFREDVFHVYEQIRRAHG